MEYCWIVGAHWLVAKRDRSMALKLGFFGDTN